MLRTPLPKPICSHQRPPNSYHPPSRHTSLVFSAKAHPVSAMFPSLAHLGGTVGPALPSRRELPYAPDSRRDVGVKSPFRRRSPTSAEDVALPQAGPSSSGLFRRKICAPLPNLHPGFVGEKMKMTKHNFKFLEGQENLLSGNVKENKNDISLEVSVGISSWFSICHVAQSSIGVKTDMVYEIGELFELGIQLSYLVILLVLLGLGTFYVIRQVLVRRELDLSAKELQGALLNHPILEGDRREVHLVARSSSKVLSSATKCKNKFEDRSSRHKLYADIRRQPLELQELVRSGDATATECFELGAVMLRRKFYPAAIKYLQQAIEKWDRDDQDLAQVYNALGVSYVRENKLDKGIEQFNAAVKLQPGYVTAWNNLGDAYEKKKNLRSALKAFEEVLLFDPNNKVARPRRDALRDRVQLYKGVPLKSEEQ